MWFVQRPSNGAPVSGPVLQEKALQLYNIFYPDSDIESFKASSGWLHKFSCSHGIRCLSLQGESLSADTSAVGDFKENYFITQTLKHCGEKEKGKS